jgi:hypothetical protein
LATAIGAFQFKNVEGVRLINEQVVNAVLVLVVVTSILGPILTEYSGDQRLAEQDAAARNQASLRETAK